MSKIIKSGKIQSSKPITAEAIVGKYIPSQPITPQRLYFKTQQILKKFGKRAIKIRIKPSQRIRAKKIKAFPTKFVDTRGKKIFPKGMKPLATHEKSFLRRYLAGGEEDPSDIMWIHLSEKGIKFFSKMQNVYLRRKLIDEIAVQMRRIHNSLLAVGAKEISHNVPKDTGLLRWSLLMSMSKRLSLVPNTKPSDIGGLVLRISLYTDLPYLQYVLKPRTITSKKGSRSMIIAHSKSMRIRSKKTGEYLHDPDAKFGFMSLIRMHLKTQARRLTRAMISSLSRQWGMSYNEVKSFFKYRGYKFR